jgi:hypothetical protein
LYYSCPSQNHDISEEILLRSYIKKAYFILCGFSMRFERAYSQGNPIKTQSVAAFLVKTVKHRKNRAAPYVPQSAVNMLTAPLSLLLSAELNHSIVRHRVQNGSTEHVIQNAIWCHGVQNAN